MSLTEDFSGQTALVVGGTGGLGRAICRLLAERGADLALTWRTDEGAAARVADDARALGAHASTHRFDLGARGDGLVREALEAHGRMDVLVYAAGPHVPQQHLSGTDAGQLAEQLRVDAAGAFSVVRAALPALRATQGNIVAVTTAATERYPVRDGLSSIPKAAVEAMIRGVAVEEGRYGVRANCVGPGMLTDGMAQRLIESGDLDDRALAAARGNIPLRRFGIAADIAEAVCFLASERAGFISGQKVSVDGGYSA